MIFIPDCLSQSKRAISFSVLKGDLLFFLFSIEEEINIIREIVKCNKCPICIHQTPLIDNVFQKNCQVFWVGLSAKLVDDKMPLSFKTNSGKIIQKIQESFSDISMYRTNIVKCVPQSESGKIRYPNRQEIETCIPYFDKELELLSPKVVFLLGEQVSKTISKRYSITFDKWEDFRYRPVLHNNIWFVPIHHPSYIFVYKRNQMSNYINSVTHIIDSLIGKNSIIKIYEEGGLLYE